jgi:uncharacterized protein (UPF0332 family)
MASDASKKLLEKITSSQYALLRSLTDGETLDARWLERAVTSIVRDRFAPARGFIKAARILSKSKDPLVKRGAVSRAYYGAYHAARATFFAIKRHDQDSHDALIKEVDQLVGVEHGAGNRLKELRLLRHEADYSPYPVPSFQAPYDPRKFESIIRESIRRAEELIRLFQKHLRERR